MALVVNHQSCQRPRSDADGDGDDSSYGIKVLAEKLDAIHGEKLGIPLNGDNSTRFGLEGG